MKSYDLTELDSFLADYKANKGNVVVIFKSKPEGYGKGKKIRECSVKAVHETSFAMTYMRNRKVNWIPYESLEEATFKIFN